LDLDQWQVFPRTNHLQFFHPCLGILGAFHFIFCYWNCGLEELICPLPCLCVSFEDPVLA
jgi:hypothetical protein